MGEYARTAGSSGPPALAGIDRYRPRSAVPILSIILLLLCALPCSAQTAAPTPAEFLGFEPGTDRKLADYDQVYAYFQKLAATTDRVRFSSIGKTTENHELGLAIISSAKNLANLEDIRKTNLALVDPRKLKPGESAGLIARGKTIVCLNASIHSIEVGPTQATLPLAHFLATTTDPEWLAVLDDVVLLMLPCHNPDGYLKIVDWYRKWVGTPYEACPFPGLYHTYAGHDNNRDWFMFNLQETRLTVKQIYQPWVPQIVMDMHQMKEDGPRMFMPPYQDPIEPNVDPILIDQLNDLGLSVQKGLIGKGMTGIVNRTLFDGWSPSRAYMHYHGGVRFLCEIASCRQATPIEKKGLAHGAASRSSTNPAPWNGDRWALADIVRYHNEAALAVLRHASRNREHWLWSFHQIFRKACLSAEGPAAFVIPFKEADADELRAAWRLLEILEFGGVECSVLPKKAASADASHAGVAISREQPFFSFARALIEPTPYPEIRETPGGPIRRPYDITAHCLPILWGLDALSVANPLQRSATRPRTGSIDELPRIQVCGFKGSPGPPRVGLYSSFIPNVIDEGWMRFLLDHEFFLNHPAPYASIHDSDIAALTGEPGGLRVIVLPSLTADQISNGNRAEDYPPEYRGGIGDRGTAGIDRFVREGGTLIAIKDATALPIQIFRLPIKNAVSNLPEGRRLDIIGATVRVNLDAKHPIAGGGVSGVYGPGNTITDQPYFGPSWVPVVFEAGKAFDPDPSPDRDQSLKPTVVGRWAPADSLRLAGYAEGLDLIAGKGAVIECAVGKGKVILFAFSPQFRGQSLRTFQLLRNAVRTGLERN